MNYLKIILSSLLWVALISAVGQSIEPGLALKTGFSYRTMDEDLEGQYPLFSYGGDIILNYSKGRWQIGSALGWSSLGSLERKELVDSGGEPAGVLELISRYNFIHIPIQLDYKIVDSKFPVYLGLGYANYFFVSEYLNTEREKTNVSGGSNRRYNSVISSRLGVELPLFRSVRTLVFGSYEYFPQSLYRNSNHYEYGRKLHNISLNFEFRLAGMNNHDKDDQK